MRSRADSNGIDRRVGPIAWGDCIDSVIPPHFGGIAVAMFTISRAGACAALYFADVVVVRLFGARAIDCPRM